MENRQRLFIYDRKEMIVLILLGLMVAVFAFTLGVHLGKRVGTKTGDVHHSSADPHPGSHVDTTADQVPNRQELTEQARGVPEAVDESLNQSLHDEVGRTGIKLDQPKPTDLPHEPRSANGGATTLETPAPAHKAPKAESPKTESPKTESHHGAAAHPEAAHEQPKKAPEQVHHETAEPEGRYTLQVGSHPTRLEAQGQVSELEAVGLKPFLKEVVLKTRGKWFRVFVGGFDTKEQAEQAGEQYRKKQLIKSFVVSNRAD